MPNPPIDRKKNVPPNEPERLPDESDSHLVNDEKSKSTSVFSDIKKELSEEELSTSGVQKLILDLLSKSEREVQSLRSYQDKFYEADKNLEVLKEKLKINIYKEAISMGTITIGSVLLGITQSAWGTQYGWPFLASGIVLIIVAIAAKVYIIR